MLSKRIEDLLNDQIKNEFYSAYLYLSMSAWLTSLIYRIAAAAQEEGDFKTLEMIKWFVTEQVEEEANATDNITQYRLFGGDGKGLYMLDAQKATRVYAVAAPLTAGA